MIVLSLLAQEARRLVDRRGTLSAGEDLRFYGLPSRLARAQLSAPWTRAVRSAFLGAEIGPTAEIWRVPVGGYLLPRRLFGSFSKCWLVVLASGGSDSVTVACPGDVRRRPTWRSTAISLNGNSWYWISPGKDPLSLLCLGFSHSANQDSRICKVPPVNQICVVLGVLPQAREIVALALAETANFRSYPSAPAMRPFDPCRDSEYEEDDRYHVLEMQEMTPALRRSIETALTPLAYSGQRHYFQINRYEVGDYILPHRDDLAQGVYLLTSGKEDGLVMQSGNAFVRVSGSIGAAVLADARAWHWIDPVAQSPRVTLVTIPPLDLELKL